MSAHESIEGIRRDAAGGNNNFSAYEVGLLLAEIDRLRQYKLIYDKAARTIIAAPVAEDAQAADTRGEARP